MHHGTPLLPPLVNAGKLFKSTQTQPAQRSRINDIEHTIPLVAKHKLAYIELKQLPTKRNKIQQMHLYCSANDSMKKGT